MTFLNRIWNKLDLRLTFLVLLFSILPLIILGVFAFDRSQQVLEQQRFDHLNAVAMLKGDEINRWVRSNVQQLNALAQRPLVREYAAVLAEGETAITNPQLPHDNLLTNHLLPQLANEDGFWELFLLDAADGQILVSTDENNEGKYRRNEPYFLEGQKEAYVQNVYFALSLEQPAMTIGTPIRNSQDEVVAVLAGHLDLAELSKIAQQTNELTESEDTYFVNQFNFFVTDPRFGDNYALHQTIHTEGITRCLKQENGQGIYQDYRGIVVLGAYRWLPQRELCVVTEIDQIEAVASINELRRSLLIVGALAAVGIGLSGIFFTRAITAPLHRLMMGLERIGRGDLDYQIPVRGQDEIGQLTASFNRMASDLHQSIDERMQGQRQLLALSQAAQAAQRARTPQEVYEIIGVEMARLNFKVVVMLLTEDREHLRVGYMSYDTSLVRAGEKLTGLSAAAHRFPLSPGGYFEQILKGGETIFISPVGDFIAEAMPKAPLFLANQVANVLGIRHCIMAPLVVEGTAVGALNIIGDNLAEADVTAVSALANQTAIALQNTQYIAQLSQNEARFRAIFEHAGIGIARVDMEGKPVQVNPALQRMLGYDADELRQMVFTEFTHPDDAANDLALYKSLIAGERDMYHIEKRYVRKDGNLVWAQLIVSLVRDTKGKPQFAIGMVHDITEQKQIQQAHAEQRVFLESIYQGVDLGIFVINVSPEGEFRFAGLNPAYECLTGLKSQEVHGKAPHDLVPYIPREIADAVHANYARCLAAGQPIAFEEMIRMDDQETWWLTRLSPLRNAAGHIYRIVGTSISISERKQAEEQLRLSEAALKRLNETLEHRVVERTKALQESEARFRRAVTDAPFPIMMHAEDGEVLHLSDIWTEITGYSPEEIPTINAWTEKAYGQEMEFTREVINSLYGSNEKVKEGEFTITTKPDGRVVWDFSSSPLGSLPDGRRIVISMATDITARKEAEIELKQTLEELERSNMDLQQFAYVASHDLQEPLRMITSYLQLLQRRYGGHLDKDADEFINYAVDGAKRMKKLIKDLLAFSRVGTQGNPFDLVDAEVSVQQALINLQASVEDTNASVTYDSLPVIKADATQIVQLFQNLISNAIKFRGDTSPQISITAERCDDMWCFSVRDNGIGFEPQFASRIFIIFQRLHTQADYDGTGIGLAVCKKIIERHGGQIWADSLPGAGATFYFTIPIT